MLPCDDEPWDPIGRGRGHEDLLERRRETRWQICADTHKADQSIRFSLGRSIRWAAYGPLDGLRKRSVLVASRRCPTIDFTGVTRLHGLQI